MLSYSILLWDGVGFGRLVCLCFWMIRVVSMDPTINMYTLPLLVSQTLNFGYGSSRPGTPWAIAIFTGTPRSGTPHPTYKK